jgi:hypothetical protein
MIPQEPAPPPLKAQKRSELRWELVVMWEPEGRTMVNWRALSTPRP